MRLPEVPAENVRPLLNLFATLEEVRSPEVETTSAPALTGRRRYLGGPTTSTNRCEDHLVGERCCPMAQFNPIYLTRYRLGLIRQAYGIMVTRRWDDDDTQFYLVTLQFEHIGGNRATVLETMFREADHFYRVLLKGCERNPRSPARQMYVPLMIGHPDLPVRKNAKSSVADVSVNGGLHMQFIVIIHMGSRMKVDLDEHVNKNLDIYLGTKGVKRSIAVDHINRTPGKAAEYVMKFLGREDFGLDYAFIRPMAISEQPTPNSSGRPV